jgi:hypothetical protein
VDDAVAERLARVPGLQVNVSIDGAAPELHDSIRGVRGSWERAVRAVDRLLGRGVRVCVAHVVTPHNERSFDEFLDQVWLLGVRSLRVTPAVPVGAAAREGDWGVAGAALRRACARFVERSGGMVDVRVGDGGIAALASLEDVAPAALLVRPNGSVWMASMQPFSFGDARRDGLRACWERVRERWSDPEIRAWAAGFRTREQFVLSDRVPYRDPEHQLAPSAPEPPRRPVRARAPRAPRRADGRAPAHRLVRELALARPFAVAPLRAVDDGSGGRYVRVLTSGRACRLNRAACVVLDACERGATAEAVDALARAGLERERVERDVVLTVHALRDRGILRPASALVELD